MGIKESSSTSTTEEIVTTTEPPYLVGVPPTGTKHTNLKDRTLSLGLKFCSSFANFFQNRQTRLCINPLSFENFRLFDITVFRRIVENETK